MVWDEALRVSRPFVLVAVVSLQGEEARTGAGSQ